MNMMKFAVGASALVVVASSYAGGTFEINGRIGKATLGGPWDLLDPTLYKKQTFPGVIGDSWQIASYGEGLRSFYLSASLETNTFDQICIKTGNSAGYTATGSQHDIEFGDYDLFMTERPTGTTVYSVTPLLFQSYMPANASYPEYAKNPDINHITLTRTSAHRVAPFRLSKLSFTQKTASNHSTYDFKGGMLNAYDPAGEGTQESNLSLAYMLSVCNVESTYMGFDVFFRTNFTLRVPKFEMKNWGADVEKTHVTVDGGTVWVAQDFTTYGGLIDATNEATVAVGCTTTISTGTVMRVVNSSFNGGKNFTTKAYSTNTFVNSTLTAGKIAHSYGAVNLIDTPVTLTNAAQDAYFRGPTLISGAKSVIDMSAGTLGCDNDGVTVADGAKITTKAMEFNNGQAHLVVGSNASVTVKGDIKLSTSGKWNCKYVRVDGGTFTCVNAYLGYDGKGRLQMDGGKMNLTGAEGIKLQEFGALNDGCAELILNGGVLTTCRIRPHRVPATAKGTSVIDVNGGTISLWHTDGILYFQNTTGDGKTYTLTTDHYLKVSNGGVLNIYRIWQGPNTVGKIHFLADGGTFKARGDYSAANPTIVAMADARIGADGFIVDTGSFATYVNGDYMSATNGAGEVIAEGKFIKRGAGTLYLAPETTAWGVGAKVEAGTLVYRTCPATGVGNVEVASGATLSISDVNTLTVSNLTVTGGTLALDPGDKLVVKGAVALSGFKVNWTSIPTEYTPFLEVAGKLSQDAISEIRKSAFANTLPAGTHASFAAEYDAASDTTVIKAMQADDAPITDLVVWQGADEGQWTNAANWVGGKVPTMTQKAAFTSATAGKDVAVAGEIEVGALTFADDGYALTGDDNIFIAAETGVAQVEVTAGSHTVDTPLKFFDQVAFPINTNAVLTVKKPMLNGGVTKTGIGKLVLEGANATEKGISSADGITEVKNAGAFGGKDGEQGSFTLGGGTVVFGGETPLHITDKVTVNTAKLNGFAAFKTDVDTTFDYIRVESGSFIKRGVGTMTVNVPAGTTYQVGVQGGTSGGSYYVNQIGISFPEDGTTPPEGEHSGDSGEVYYRYPGFGVYEGELVFKGQGDGAKIAIAQKGSSIGTLGVTSKGCKKDSVLTLDNVEFETGSAFLIGDSTGYHASPLTTTLNLLNGAKIHIASTQIGYGCTYTGGRININATDSTFSIASGNYICRAYGNPYSWVAYTFKNSTLQCTGDSFVLGGHIKGDFDGGFFGKSDGSTITISSESSRPFGELFFHNGATLALSQFLEATNDKVLTFAFNDAEWKINSTRATATYAASTTGKVKYEMRGAGATFKPASGATYTMNATLEGEGGITLDGAGTLAFGEGALAFTGSPVILQGTLDAAGQTIVEPTVAFTPKATVPVLEDCVISGRLLVDCGGVTPAVGAQAVVAKFAGSTSAADLKVKLVNTGGDKCAVSAAVDAEGNVTLTVLPRPGTILFIR